jgi:hypothetical protein
MSKLLDTIIRTYRNGAGDIIAIQKIIVDQDFIDAHAASGMIMVGKEPGENRFKRTALIKLQTQLSPKSGASATIATVVTSGSYSSRAESGGDVVSATYAGDLFSNDLEIPVNTLDGVFAVGDTI